MLQSTSCTKKVCTLLYYHKNTSIADYNRILFSGIKLSKEFCLHHIGHETVLITAKDIYSCMIAHQIHQIYISKGVVSIFMAQLCVCILLNSDSIKTILIPPL